jgi:hypothetical protein
MHISYPPPLPRVHPFPQQRYNEISLVYRMWVYLQMLKRGGAVHYADGIEALPEGSMAVECAACPQPRRNVDATALAEE